MPGDDFTVTEAPVHVADNRDQILPVFDLWVYSPRCLKVGTSECLNSKESRHDRSKIIREFVYARSYSYKVSLNFASSLPFSFKITQISC